jgi:hypothetical protein
MSWARGLGAALKGTLTGLAEAAEAEDEKRTELTKVALAQRIKMRDEALALQRTQEEKVKEQNAFIETFSGGNFAYEDKETGQINILSEADAVTLYKQSSGDVEKARKLIADGNFTLKGNGTVYTPKPITAFSSAKDSTLAALKPTEESGGFLQKGRWDQIADSVSKTLGDETITIPALKDVEGVQVTVGKGTDTEYLIEDKVMYVFDQGSNVPSKQIRQRVITDKKDPSKQEVYNFDLVTNKQITLGDNVKIASAKDAFGTDSMYKDYGFAIDVNTNQALKNENGNFVAVYQGKDGKFYQSVNGVPSDTPLDKSVVIVKPDAIAAAGGIDNLVQKLSQVAGFDEFTKLGAKLSEKEQVLETLVGNIEIAMGLNKEIGEAGYGLGGMLNEVINTGVQNVRSVGEFLISFGENGDKLSAEERYRLLSENEGAMRDLLSQRDSLLSTPGLSAIQRRSIAKVLLSTQASLLAYDTARITSEDPRITDQDFNVFQETILGTSAAKTFELLKASSERAIQSFNSQINALNRARKSIDRNSLTSGTKYYVENAHTYADNDLLNPNNLRQKLDSMYTNYAPVAQKTTVTAIKEGDNVGYYAQPVLVDPETLKPTTSANPKAVSMMALYGPDGKIVNVNNNPLVVRDGSAQDLLDKVPGLKKSGLIK